AHAVMDVQNGVAAQPRRAPAAAGSGAGAHGAGGSGRRTSVRGTASGQQVAQGTAVMARAGAS
ncbi:hypothetical protein HCK01_11450, partial [Streptomyces sp. AA8]|nr:hypothetical protein [Streptomyces telluris]